MVSLPCSVCKVADHAARRQGARTACRSCSANSLRTNDLTHASHMGRASWGGASHVVHMPILDTICPGGELVPVPLSLANGQVIDSVQDSALKGGRRAAIWVAFFGG